MMHPSFLQIARLYNLIPMACPSRVQDVRSAIAPIANFEEGWRWSPALEPIDGFELITDRSVLVIGASSLNEPGQYEIQVRTKSLRLYRPDPVAGEDLGSEVPDPPRDMFPDFMDVSAFSGLCPVDWGVSSPVIVEGMVIRVRVLNPEPDLLFAVFGTPSDRWGCPDTTHRPPILKFGSRVFLRTDRKS